MNLQHVKKSRTNVYTAPVAVPDVPAQLMHSPLMRSGGFRVFEGIADDLIWRSLLAEALGQNKISENHVDDVDTEEIRGGAPRRRFLNSSGGEFQRSFYNSPWLIGFLRGLTTPCLVPTGGNGTYSFYTRDGDFLDIHRDIVACDVAVITCLRNEGGTEGGELCLYPSRVNEPLSAIRETPDKGALKVRLEDRQTIVMYGGVVPHALLAVGKGQSRIVSVLCYRAL